MGSCYMMVVTDTNILIYLIDRVNILEELERREGAKVELIIPEPVIKELELMLNSKSYKRRKGSMLALNYLKTKGYTVEKTQSSKADESVIEVAIKRNVPIITNDKEIIIKAKKIGLKVIRVRKNKGWVENLYYI